MRTNFGLESRAARAGVAVIGMFLGGGLAIIELGRLVSGEPGPRRMSEAAITACVVGAVVAAGIILDAWHQWRARSG